MGNLQRPILIDEEKKPARSRWLPRGAGLPLTSVSWPGGNPGLPSGAGPEGGGSSEVLPPQFLIDAIAALGHNYPIAWQYFLLDSELPGDRALLSTASQCTGQHLPFTESTNDSIIASTPACPYV